MSALDGRACKAERELEGVRAARDWLAPQLEAALSDKARLGEELQAAKAALGAAAAELAAARGGAGSGGELELRLDLGLGVAPPGSC